MAYLNTASFKTDDNTKYLETYLTFDASSIKLIQKKDKQFYGDIDVRIEINTK